jgi:exodeoxyribonuclease V beta subunit
LLAIVHEKTCSREQFGNLLSDEEWCLDRMLPENLKVKGKPCNASLHYPGLLASLRQDLLPLIKAASCPMKILLRLAKDCQMHARELFVHLECFSPDQMLRLLDTALDSTPFLEAVRKKYAAAIIDEFQDTDPIQWKIFKRAFIGALDTLCLVGDPKQSIYAFRSADIYTYLDAASALGKEKHKYLDTNYRSAPVLVHALNQLFSSPKGEGWLALPRIQRAMPVDPVKAGSKEIDKCSLLCRGAIHFFIGSAKRGRGAQWPSNEMEENVLFPFLASEIWALKQKRDVPWEEIAVLVKDRFQAMRLLTYFKQYSIPSSFRRGENISGSDALFAFKDCLEAVLNPSDLSTLKIALGGILIGWNETHLRADWNSSFLHRAKIHMQLLQKTLLEKGFGPFFHSFLNLPWFLDEQGIGEKILRRGDLALYQDLRKLAEILIEEELTRKLQGEDFLIYLREMQGLAEEQEQRFAIPPTESRGSVSLMTIHLSKGLEFDTVFALALASRHMIREDEPVKKGSERQWIAFEETDPACLEAMEEIDAEKMRSLYVALTRAKQQLYIPYIIDESDKPLKIGNASPIELFFARMSQECKSSQQLYEEIAQLKQEGVNKLLRELSTSCSLTYDYLNPSKEQLLLQNSTTPPCTLVPPSTSVFVPDPIRLYSFSSLASKHSDPVTLPSLSASSDRLPLGASTGTVVHSIFEDIFKRSLHHPLQEKKIKELLACEIAGSPLESFQAMLFDLVIDHLNLLLLPNAMRLRDVPASQLFCEMEFLFPYERIAKPQFGSKNAMMKGFADLIFLYEDKYYLLDWKTNYLGPSHQEYSQEKIADAMAMHQYFLQASIYAAALKRYVKLFDNRPFEEIFGGAFYVFVRGKAVFHFFPSAEELKLI